MKNLTLKDKLKRRELTIGSWVTINHQSIIEVMSNKGFEWLTLDIEHSSFDFEDIKNLIAHIQHNDMAALVRVYANDEVVIKRVMDAGADGIIVPMVNTSDDLIKIKDYFYYPPRGKRGVGLNRAQEYGFGFEKYKEWLDNKGIIIAQIEHIDAIENLESIIKADIADALFIGPYDLSASMGYPGKYEREDVKIALKKFEDICIKENISFGYHIVPPDSDILIDKKKIGYNFLAFSLDFFFLGEAISNEMTKIKGNI